MLVLGHKKQKDLLLNLTVKDLGVTLDPDLSFGRFPSLHWDSLPLTLLQGVSHWLTGALSCRPYEGCVT